MVIHINYILRLITSTVCIFQICGYLSASISKFNGSKFAFGVGQIFPVTLDDKCFVLCVRSVSQARRAIETESFRCSNQFQFILNIFCMLTTYLECIRFCSATFPVLKLAIYQVLFAIIIFYLACYN